MKHLSLVRGIAGRFRAKVPHHLELNDLVQAGFLGLLDAAGRYTPDVDSSFSTYATHRIRGAILDSLRKEDTASRKLKQLGAMLQAKGIRTSFAL